ncbi:hypothetical protein L1987_69812 [Smallanthus sonchifolius]|uniref:Uncharacterized protein n=1 Tax=Smallanthus sonchifolius TaxID=185202 RepID=A0ACB9B7I1_9ASTR|nr:hypothetical protein L1987_69812 [Smallanthus sonchifolius]
MGQIVKRKRRGRPSNLERAHRTSPVSPPSPADRRSSRRRRNVRYNFDVDDFVDEDEFYAEDVGSRENKLRLLLSEDDFRSDRRVSSSSSSDDDYFKHSKKRRLNGDDDEDNEIEIRGRKLEEDDDEEAEAGGSDFDSGTESDLQNGVSMPDKRTLELILNKLQKKDIYGVYTKPVDPEELPDYHDVIKHPMNFATVRKKLAKGLYLTLKEFESDVFLICTNAMQYNAPDTIYYNQASSIQEQAKLKFQRLRVNFDRSEVELIADHKFTPSFSPPKKQIKKSVARTTPDPDPVGSETSSGAAIRAVKFPNGSSAQTPVKPNSGEVQIAGNSSLDDNNLEKDQELLPGKGFMSKLERTPSIDDENRRATYNISFEPVTDSDSVFSTFEGESKQFIPVGLHANHSYARSLARFAATLGPVAWKIASHIIEQALPEAVKFGPGWVGEYEPLPTPILLPENCTLKEPNFLAHFRITSDVIDNKIRKEEASDGFNPGIPIKQESLKEARKDPSPCPSPRPTFYSGFNPGIPIKQESLKVARKDPSPSPSPRPTFYSGSNFVHQNLQSRDSTRPENTFLPLVELNHPPPVHVSSAADFVAKRLISNASDITSKPDLRNGNLASLASFKHLNSNNDRFAPASLSIPVGLDCNRMVPMENNTTPRQDPQGLSNPVQMIADKTQHQLNNSNGFGFGSKQDDSNNAASAAAQAWMSLGGGAGGLIKPKLPENANSHKQQISVDSLYNPARHQPQVTRFRGEFNTYQQPVRMVNDGQLQNRNVGFPPMVTAADLSRFQVQSGWRGVPPQMQQPSRPKQQESRPPDLNIGHQSIGSPVRLSTGMLVDSQQPDLSLQL